jgi:RND family efflux transporter MFP subunit
MNRHNRPSPHRIELNVLLAACLVATAASGIAQRAAAQIEREGMLGVLTPQLEVELEPSIEGQLVAVHVRIGDYVMENELVAEIDDEPLRRDLDEAEARLEAARAQEGEAETRLRIAENVLERQRTLVEQQAVSREAVRAAEQDVELAVAATTQARAGVRQQEAAVEQYRGRLRQAQIRAPFAGTVAERYGNPGMTVGPGTAVVRLISSERLWARFASPVEDARHLALGRSVRAIVTDIGQELRGTISQIGSEVDPASGMIICEALIVLPESWNGPPLSGQAVRIRLDNP